MRRLLRFNRNERASAMTEFVMFLPIFVVVFAGIVNLGKFGYSTTQNKILAQKALWTGVIPVTHSTTTETGSHMSSVIGGGDAGLHLADLALDGSNPQQAADGVEGGLMGLGLGVGGHWGESYGRTIVVSVLPGVGGDLERHESAEDVIGDQPFPQALLNDSVNRPRGSGGIVGSILQYIAGSGVVAALGAGIRYGTVFGEHEHTFTVGRIGSFKSRSHYDVLVAPSPLKGAATKTSWALARAYAESEDNYSVMMNFGESEWEGDSSGGSSMDGTMGDLGDFDPNFDPDSDDYQDQIDEAIRESEEQEGGGG